MKHKDGFYFQVSRHLFDDRFSDSRINQVSLSAFKMLIWLHELEQRYTTGDRDKPKKGKKKQDWFFRSDKDLASDTGLSERSIRSAKKDLEKYGLIETWQMHWLVDGGKLSHKHVTAYRIK